MNIANDIYKLNSLLKKRVFCEGNYKQKIKEIIKGYSPFGKVAFITLYDTHTFFAKEVLSAISGVSSKMISFVIKNVPKNDISVFNKIFNLPDDVRVVITLDKELIRLCSYYSSVKNILFIYVPTTCYFCDILNPYIYLKNGDKIDRVSIDAKTRVILDFDLIKEKEIAESFAYIMSKTVALIDYRIYTSINKLPLNKLALNLLKDNVVNTYKIFSSSKTERAKRVVINLLYIEVANVLLNGVLSLSSFEIAKTTIESIGMDKCDMGNMIFFADKILKLYGNFFSIKQPLQVASNLNERINLLSGILNVSSSFVAEKLLEQITIIEKNGVTLTKLLSSMQKVIKNVSDNFNSVISTYLALNGKDDPSISEKDVNAIIKLSGDYPYSVNGISVLRYLGVTDLDIFD